MKIKIAPSILSSNFAELGKEIKLISESGADYIHIDVMDGNFVPNITIGPPIIKAIKPYSTLPFDVHLMVSEPEKLIDDFIDAGANIITFHIEATNNASKLIEYIKNRGVKVGISLMPKSSEKKIFPFLEDIDLVLVMTVRPGFGGQMFMNSEIDKISRIRKKIDSSKHDVILSVDGGINNITAKLALQAGADMLVTGSYFFKQKDFKKAVIDLKIKV